MDELCTEIGYGSLNKKGEQLCGDHIETVWQEDSNSVIMVLADGLGSGVKASILSTLTSKIISTMMSENMCIEECVSTIASTLPVCEVRQIAYSTFTIVKIVDNEEAEIIEYDNPSIILLRDGKNYEFPKTSVTIDNKVIYKSKIKLCENDIFIVISDGVVHAGIGSILNYGWQRENIVNFMEKTYQSHFTAKTLSTILLDECKMLYDNEPGDDTTVSVIRIRQRKPVNLLIGPPVNISDEKKMMDLFFSKKGKHIVCGGTTSRLVAKYLDKNINTFMDYIDPDIPPTANIEGIDLVTEGIVTINKVLVYARNYLEDNKFYIDWSTKKDGASLIARMLFEDSTDINFYVGCAINPANNDSEHSIDVNLKLRLVDELAECLKKTGKKVKVSYF